ncbi:hypothetical protein ABZ922_30195 [Streptomyces shenzhenensis]|uniref:hypothetical protein n=1 Tax=Streptomyces shenzhenensis TaxID=943815 RepID=UPI0033E249C5
MDTTSTAHGTNDRVPGPRTRPAPAGPPIRFGSVDPGELATTRLSVGGALIRWSDPQEFLAAP